MIYVLFAAGILLIGLVTLAVVGLFAPKPDKAAEHDFIHRQMNNVGRRLLP